MLEGNKGCTLFNYASFLTISCVAILFGYWFASMQVNAVLPNALISFPIQYFVLTIFKCYLTVIAFFVFSQLILSHLAAGKLPSFQVALTYAPLVLVYLHSPISWIVCLIFTLQLICLLRMLQHKDYQRLKTTYAMDAIVLLIFFTLHFLITTRFSPLHWDKALLVAQGYNSEEIPLLVPIFQSFVLAKQFSFSSVDYAQWAGIMHPPIGLGSTLMQLMVFIFDIPSVSYAAFHVLISALYFILMVAGSFGFYLFMKYTTKVHNLFAFFGGCLFTFSGSPFLSQMFTSDGGIFLSSLVVFPYALLAISYAFNKNDYRYAAWAGLALAAQFFIFAPHPEGTIYTLFFYCIYTLGLFLFSSQLAWIKRFYLAAISVAAFFMLAAFILIPIMTDKLTGNMFVYAHTGDINSTYYMYYQAYVHLLMVLAPISLLLLYIHKKITPVYLSSLLLSLCIIGCVPIIINTNYVAKVLHLFHIGLHIWVPSRIGVYVYFSVLVISIYGLDMITRVIFDLTRKKYAYALGE